MLFRKMILVLLLASLVLAMTACTSNSASSIQETTSEIASEQLSTTSDQADTVVTQDVEYDSEDLAFSQGLYTLSYIHLEGETITTSGSGVSVEGNTATILSPGAYNISGTLSDGQINVNTQEDGTVVLILDSADINSSTSAPIYVRNAEKVILHLAEGSLNTISDSPVYQLEDASSNEPNAAIFSSDDLVINGSGTLIVNASYNNGIASRDDLKITGGTLLINAANDGLKGKDYVAIHAGTITIEAGGDGIQSDNDTDTSKGYVVIEGGSLTITAGLDGIQAETSLQVSGGSLDITTGGGSANSSTASQDTWGNWGNAGTTDNGTNTDSAKGLKAGTQVIISGGEFTIDSSDDAIHSNNTLVLSGGTLRVASGDDGLHADSTLSILGGELTILQSYEGIESASIVITSGTIHVNSYDDGLNTAGGADGSSLNGRPGQNEFSSGGDYNLLIQGGYVYVDAQGDGVDINGRIDMSAGTLIINGPTNDGNGALDYTSGFTLTGGLLVAAGSSGMAQMPDDTSTQYSLMYGFESAQSAGSTIRIECSSADELLTFTPTKTYQSIVVSSAALGEGTCTLSVGGQASGNAVDGLYTGGGYASGTQVAEIDISSLNTIAGTVGQMGPGIMGGKGPRP